MHDLIQWAITAHLIHRDMLHGHRVFVTNFDGEAWLSAFDAIRHLLNR